MILHHSLTQQPGALPKHAADSQPISPSRLQCAAAGGEICCPCIFSDAVIDAVAAALHAQHCPVRCSEDNQRQMGHWALRYPFVQHTFLHCCHRKQRGFLQVSAPSADTLAVIAYHAAQDSCCSQLEGPYEDACMHARLCQC